jgi:hypothetical protein
MHTTVANTVSTVSTASSVRDDDHHPGQNNPSRDRPMMSAMTTVARIWSARARSGRPPSRLQTMLTVLTQTPPFVSGNRAGEP